MQICILTFCKIISYPLSAIVFLRNRFNVRTKFNDYWVWIFDREKCMSCWIQNYPQLLFFQNAPRCISIKLCLTKNFSWQNIVHLQAYLGWGLNVPRAHWQLSRTHRASVAARRHRAATTPRRLQLSKGIEGVLQVSRSKIVRPFRQTPPPARAHRSPRCQVRPEKRWYLNGQNWVGNNRDIEHRCSTIET